MSIDLNLPSIAVSVNSINLCRWIRNCGQCKEMYGDYFDGRRCAEFCLTGAGAKLPDCNVPDTVDRFFKTGDQALRESNAVEVERGSGDMWKRFMGIKRRYLSRPSYL